MSKVTVVGAGNVGATCAHALLRSSLADVVLIDIDEGLAKGKALDLAQAGAIEGFTTSIIGDSDYGVAADSDVVVITAGLPRRPGMTREELLEKNARIVSEVAKRSLEVSAGTTVVVVTNPLDIMVNLTYRVSGLPASRVVGMGGLLDSARFKHFIASATGSPVGDIDAMVIGAHSDSMVPLISLSTVAGRPLLELISADEAMAVVEKTKNGGAEIVSHLKIGSAFYAPGVAAAEMAASILTGEGRLLPACAMGSGVYGVEGSYIGLPVVLGTAGVAEVVELPIDEAEREALARSLTEIETGLEALGKYY